MRSKHLESVTGSSIILTQCSTDGMTADRHVLIEIRDTCCGMTMSSFYWLSGCDI